MDQVPKRTIRGGPKAIVTASVFIWLMPGHAHELQSRELKQCIEIEGDAARLACYDEVSGRLPPQAIEQSQASTVDEDTSAEEYAPLTDDVGVESLPPEERKKQDGPVIRAIVTACRQDARDKYYFYFDNGQVWKQKDDDRLRYKDCNFSVIILKDFFGYKMQVEGEEKRIRISRVR